MKVVLPWLAFVAASCAARQSVRIRPEWRVLSAGASDVVVVSLDTNSSARWARLGAASLADKRAYCARHGYHLVWVPVSLDRGRRPHWSKLHALLALLDEYEYVAWFDSDALVLNALPRVERYFEAAGAHADLIAQRDVGAAARAAAPRVNSGVLLARRSRWARALVRASLRRWEAELLHGIWHFHLEQSALQLALDALPARERAAKVRLVAHPALWMLGTAANLGWAAGLLRDGAGACGAASALPFAIHFAGCGLGECREHVRRAAGLARRCARLGCPPLPQAYYVDALDYSGGRI